MAINLICPKCSTNLSVRSKICRNCDYEFKNGKSTGYSPDAAIWATAVTTPQYSVSI